eukprot:14550990-Alexandrium_andersonii.AAC.1
MGKTDHGFEASAMASFRVQGRGCRTVCCAPFHALAGFVRDTVHPNKPIKLESTTAWPVSYTHLTLPTICSV